MPRLKKVIERERFCDLLRSFKLDAGLTWDEVSHVCKIPAITLKQYESGLRKPSLGAAVAIHRGLGIPLDRIAACAEFN